MVLHSERSFAKSRQGELMPPGSCGGVWHRVCDSAKVSDGARGEPCVCDPKQSEAPKLHERRCSVLGSVFDPVCLFSP